MRARHHYAQPASPFQLSPISQARRLKGDLDSALADFDRAIETRPRLAVAYNNRGNVHLSRGNSKQAIDDFSKAIQADPRLPETHYNRGRALYLAGEWERAVADLDQSIRRFARFSSDARRISARHPHLASALLCRGQVQQALGRLDRALADFERALVADPASARALNHRG